MDAEIKEKGLIGRIPAFKSLAIIFEKEKSFDKAIEIWNKAISYGQSDEEFVERKQRIKKKWENYWNFNLQNNYKKL